METKRTVEVFSAGCVLCEEAVSLVERIACDACEVTVLDIRNDQVAARARELGIRTVPAVVANGKLAACCKGAGPSESELRASGIGHAL